MAKTRSASKEVKKKNESVVSKRRLLANFKMEKSRNKTKGNSKITVMNVIPKLPKIGDDQLWSEVRNKF